MDEEKQEAERVVPGRVEISRENIKGAAAGSAASAALGEVFRRLRDREDPPSPWKGSGEVPWAEADFSADYARVTARGAEITLAEIEYLVSVTQLPLDPPPRQAWAILDLGCGDGRLLLPLARMGHRGFGLDLGPSPVNQLKEEAKQQGLPIEAQVADLRDWSKGQVRFAGAEAFDLILLSFGTLGAVERPEAEALLTRASEVLRPGGWLYLDMGLSAGFADELDGRQEWWTSEDFVTGRGRQLVLDEHSFDSREKVYVRRSFALRMEEPVGLSEVRQTSQLYESGELRGGRPQCLSPWRAICNSHPYAGCFHGPVMTCAFWRFHATPRAPCRFLPPCGHSPLA